MRAADGPHAAVIGSALMVTPSGLAVEVQGSGTPAVLLIHAGITDRRMWDRQFAVFAQRTRVIRYDVRGFGASPDPTAAYFDHDDACEVLDITGTDRAVVVGASNGGRIALDLAVSAPARVAGLMLAAAGLPGGAEDPALEAAFAREGAALEAGDIATAREINLRAWIDGAGRDPGDADPALRARAAAWLDTLLPRQAAQLRSGAGEAQEIDPPLRARLGDIAVPTLVLVGAHDQPSFRAMADDLVAGIPGSRLLEIAGAAHLPSLERPDDVDTALASFLDDLSA